MTDVQANQLLVAPKTHERFSYGMNNHGNTCFFNATMQCLTATVPMRDMLLSSDHPKKCKLQECYICAYIRFLQGIKKDKRTQPLAIVKSLPRVWRSYHIGQQRDAHEFLTIYLE